MGETSALKGKFPAEAGRYRLIWSPASPWAHCSVIVCRLLGLEEVISLAAVDPIRPDSEVSDRVFTQEPVLVDLTTGKIVNNDYFNLTRYLEVEWKPFHKEGAPDLYPGQLREEIDKMNDILFHEVNNGVYKVGNAQTQHAYDEACDILFRRLDALDERLEDRRYLFGDRITESDVRLYVTLARFDAAYYNGFRANRKMIRDYPNLWRYARNLYRIPGFGDTTDFEAIKKHYHVCLVVTNPCNIVPLGPENADWLTE